MALTGAGISAESGLKTFRDSDGLWEGYDIMEVATPEAWARNPELVLDFYNMRRRNVADAMPNKAHEVLAELEEHYDVHIVTQNIDNLHEQAGSTNVLHLHGEIFKARSESNEDLIFPMYRDMYLGEMAVDGSRLRPHIVWFGEPVPMIEEAIPIMSMADVFVLVGTSLAVYPAAGLVDYVPTAVDKYVLDKAIPSVGRYDNVIKIEKPATEGAQFLKEALLANLK